MVLSNSQKSSITTDEFYIFINSKKSSITTDEVYIFILNNEIDRKIIKRIES